MESNWRWNVWDLGLSSTPITLVARLHGFPGRYLTDLTGPGMGIAFVAADIGGDRGIFIIPILSVTRFTPHFPYGHEVEPD